MAKGSKHTRAFNGRRITKQLESREAPRRRELHRAMHRALGREPTPQEIAIAVARTKERKRAARASAKPEPIATAIKKGGPVDLEQAAKSIEDLRTRLLFESEHPEFGPEAEQHFLAAIAALEMAQRHMALANLAQVRAVAADQLRR